MLSISVYRLVLEFPTHRQVRTAVLVHEEAGNVSCVQLLRNREWQDLFIVYYVCGL